MQLVTKDDFDAAFHQSFRAKTNDIYQVLETLNDERVNYCKEQQIDLVVRNNCPICDSSYNETYLSKDQFKLLKCQDCQFIFNNSLIGNTMKLLTENPLANEALSLYSSAAYKSLTADKYRYILQNIKKYQKANSLLDIGCYTGDLLEIAQNEFNFKTFGIDCNLAAISIARQKGVSAMKCHLPEDSAIIKDRFSSIVLLDVLEHIPNPIDFLNDIKTLLTKTNERKLVIVQVPNEESLFVKLNGKSNWNYCLDHCNYFTKATLSTVMQQAGFKTLQLETYISELDKIMAYSSTAITKTINNILDYQVTIPTTITTNWLHQHYLGYKLFYIGYLI